MGNYVTYIQMISAAICNWFNWFMGDIDNLLYTLITFVMLEYLSSIICGIKDKVAIKEIIFSNICRKLLIFVMVGVGHILGSYVIGENTILRPTIITFYITIEGVSLLKNVVKLHLPVPPPLNSIFEQFLSKSFNVNNNSKTPISKNKDNR